MSVLKIPHSLRGVSPQRLLPCTCAGSNILVCERSKVQSSGTRHNGTFSSTFTRHFRTSDPKSETEKDSPGNPSVTLDRKERLKVSLSALGETVPLKIAEMNKYISGLNLVEVPRKFITSTPNSKPKLSHNKANTSIPADDSSSQSFEDAIDLMNTSISSFYDTSCATDPSKDIVNRGKHPRMIANRINFSSYDCNDDEFSPVDVPVGPLFPSSTPSSSEAKKKRAEARRAEKISRLSLESRTKSLVQSLKTAHSLMSKITRVEELCEHLIAHPECVWDASTENVVPTLKNLTRSPDKLLQGLSYEALSLLGHVKQLTSPGIRILSIDGGGTRGLVTIEFLKSLEKQSGCRIHQLFDYVCGTSTGALLATLICLYKVPLDRCVDLYKDCSTQMFTRNRVVGTTKLVWSHGFYDSQSWEAILQREMGEKTLIEFSREPDVPKLSAVSTLMSTHKMTAHLFRTYNAPPGSSSQYPGTCRPKVWEVIRASSAAPGYFESFKMGDQVHEDGGILNNNPTALAIHESRLLWPNENIHCVVSLGTGRFDSVDQTPAKLSLKRKLTTIVDSATDTEAVHQTLQDLLPTMTYFRFNPYLSEEFYLDEIRPEKMNQMQHDAQMYTRRNSYKVKAAARRLLDQRRPQQVVGDWIKQTVGQR